MNNDNEDHPRKEFLKKLCNSEANFDLTTQMMVNDDL